MSFKGVGCQIGSSAAALETWKWFIPSKKIKVDAWKGGDPVYGASFLKIKSFSPRD